MNNTQPKRKASRRNIQTAESVAIDDKYIEITMSTSPVGDAAFCLGTLKPGGRVVGLTWGQFSLIDMIRAVLDQIGPADVLLSAWTLGIRDGEIAGYLLREKKIRTMRFMVADRFPLTEPAYCGRLVQVFGAECFTLAPTHAKFVVLSNDKWNIVIQSSMNLNTNPQLEQFDLTDSKKLADFFKNAEMQYRKAVGPGVHWTGAEVRSKSKGAFKDEILQVLKKWEEEQEKREIRENAAAQVAVAAPSEQFPTEEQFLLEEFRRLDVAMVAALRSKGQGVEKISIERQKVYAKIRAIKEAQPQDSLSASQAGAALVDAVIDAPRAIQWEIYQRLSELPGFADGDDEDEDDDEPEERPPLRAVRGGKK